jgi:hypothetical protein
MTWYRIRCLSERDRARELAQLSLHLPAQDGTGIRVLTDAPGRRGPWWIYLNQMALSAALRKGYIPDTEEFGEDPPMGASIVRDY